jgi:serine/threonine protein kinase
VRYLSRGDDYLMSEYIDGEDLAAFINNHPDYFKSRKNVDRLISQLLDVVGYLHQHQIVHLDLKPANILITRIGYEVKLTDLGYCYTDSYADTMGRTDKYAAPEQLDATSRVDARTDIYAIGKILQTLPRSYKYNKVIARCTASDPSKRYQNIVELKKALKHSSFPLTVAIVIPLLIVMFLGFYLSQNQATQPSRSDDDSIPSISSVKTREIQEPLSSDKSENSKIVSPPKRRTLTSSEQLKKDIEAAVLPKFNATMGALPDSVTPGTDAWVQAAWAFERELSNTLQDLILAHQDVPMQTVAQEYNSYVESLITLKVNQKSPTP